MRIYKVIGIMSGSSMDGTDLAYCEIATNGSEWKYEIKIAETIPYEERWRVRLSQIRKQTALTYVKTDVFYGYYLAELVTDFIKKHNLKPDFVSSHGHTVFHNPESHITAQVGDGASLSARCGLPVVSDFRRADLALGGEGAPLVGIGDKLLFSEFDFCLNLGGFANISADFNGKRIAYDICAANILLNRVARDFGKSFDEDGKIAEKGKINYELLGELNAIEYYSRNYPKSLNRDWINEELWHIVKGYKELAAEDKMKTLVDHIAVQIAKSIENLSNGNSDGKKVLLTGGGAFNKTLVDHILTHTEAEIVIPDTSLVQYKEALVFALLGALRIENKFNTLATATGAKSDSIGGGLHGNFSFLLG